MNRRQDYIGIFDSGVGGISVLRHLRRLMPQERFLYYGDSANAPYGPRTTEEIRSLALATAEKLVAQGIKALVVACNTATSAAIDLLRQTYPELIVVGIEPALKLAAQRFPKGCIAVMATQTTLREEKFQALLGQYSNTCQVVQLSAPGLVELVEQGKGSSKESLSLLRPILEPWKGKLDALVLGCTHYPFASAPIRDILGDTTLLFDGGEGTAKETKRRLEAAGLINREGGCVVWQNSLVDSKMTALCQQLLEGA